jgi:hypothetical protein
MGDHGNRVMGAALVGIGLLMLLGELGVTPLKWLWPLAVLVIGAIVLFDYRRKRDDSGKVFTGTTLILIGAFLLVVTAGMPMQEHWPFFLAAPGLGLLAMAKADPRRRDAMVPGWMAIAGAAVLYFFTLGIFVGLLEIVFDLLGLILKVVVPLGLIAGGAWMLFQQHQARRDREDFPEKVEPEGPGGARPRWSDTSGAEGAGAAAGSAAAGGAAPGDAAAGSTAATEPTSAAEAPTPETGEDAESRPEPGPAHEPPPETVDDATETDGDDLPRPEPPVEDAEVEAEEPVRDGPAHDEPHDEPHEEPHDEPHDEPPHDEGPAPDDPERRHD